MRNRGSERGAAAVEFALVVPLLLVLVMGIAEFGRAYNRQAILSGAAREGARTMALSGTSATAKTAAVNAAAPTLTLMHSNVVITFIDSTTGADSTSTSCGTGLSTRVTVNHTMPYLSRFFGTSKPLKGVAVMRCNG